MKKSFLLLLLTGSILLSGCAIAPNYLKIHPNIGAFKPPDSAVVLPFSNIMGLEAANETANSMFAAKLTERKWISQIIAPSAAIATMSRPDIAQAVTQLRTQFSQTSTINKEAVGTIGKVFNVDAILWGDLTKWGRDSVGGTAFTSVGMSLKMVNVKSGELLWSSMHVTEERGSAFGLLGALGGAILGGDPYTKPLEKTCKVILDSYPFKTAKSDMLSRTLYPCLLVTWLDRTEIPPPRPGHKRD